MHRDDHPVPRYMKSSQAHQLDHIVHDSTHRYTMRGGRVNAWLMKCKGVGGVSERLGGLGDGGRGGGGGGSGGGGDVDYLTLVQ